MIARLVAADEDTVCDVIHRFKSDRPGLPGPSVGGRPVPDSDFDVKLERIEYALTQRPGQAFAFDGFGPAGHPPGRWVGMGAWGRPAAGHLPPHPRITYFHGCYSVGDDLLWGANRRRKGIDHTWAALTSIRAAHSDGAPIYVILDKSVGA